MPSSLPASAAPHTVPLLRTDAELLAAAATFAERLRPGAPTRDATHELPHTELTALASTGLLGLPVPAEHGGAGASLVTTVEVFARLSAADPAFAQILQPHVSFLETVRTSGTPAQRARWYAAVLAGARFGNALSERGTAHVWEYRTRLTRRGAAAGSHRLNGTKYYATGAAGADWIAVVAIDDDDQPRVAYVPADAPGLVVGQDWTAFGQRSTLSGTVELYDVEVPEDDVLPFDAGVEGTVSTVGAHAQLLHGAIDLGIARGALDDGIAFVRERARPYPASGVDRVADEPAVRHHYGRLAVRIDASGALLREAAAALDAIGGTSTREQVDRARLAVAGAKALAGDVALEVATELFEGAGASATDGAAGLDRHWRNARTHTLHDPNRWKYIHHGDWLLNGTPPAPTNHLI